MKDLSCSLLWFAVTSWFALFYSVGVTDIVPRVQNCSHGKDPLVECKRRDSENETWRTQIYFG